MAPPRTHPPRVRGAGGAQDQRQGGKLNGFLVFLFAVTPQHLNTLMLDCTVSLDAVFPPVSSTCRNRFFLFSVAVFSSSSRCHGSVVPDIPRPPAGTASLTPWKKEGNFF